MYRVSYVNRDGRMLDQGIGDEAAPEFDSAEQAAAWAREQAMQIYRTMQPDRYVRPASVKRIMADGFAPDPRANGYRWLIQGPGY